VEVVVLNLHLQVVIRKLVVLVGQEVLALLLAVAIMNLVAEAAEVAVILGISVM
tara:strand:+ start:342 stop:503 length:162 start_codon:yes stop_codon:yes gene_type:complete